MSRRVVALSAGVLLGLGVVTPATAAPLRDPQAAAADNAKRQIAALQDLKVSQSKSESKMDSSLVVAKRETSDRRLAAAVPQLQTPVKADPAARVTVDIRATVSDGLVNDLRKAGAGIRYVSPTVGSIRAELPLAAIEGIAARSDVRFVEPAVGAKTSREVNTPPGPPGKAGPSKEDKAKQVEAATKRALSAKAAAATTSEGDRAHNADGARQQFGVTGVGVKICVLSDGVDSVPASQAAGELPTVDVLPGQAGSGDEGTAMLEIVHDVAPGADLGFATAFISDASFADNIRALRTQGHCDIIVDDVVYFNEGAFQDGPIARAVNDVTASGALYFSSAGNEGNTVDGTAAHWEGDFVDSGVSIGKFAGTANNFATGGRTQIYEPISDQSSFGVVNVLKWADPLGASTNDYDLYLLDGNGNVLQASQSFQTGTQDPYERVNTSPFGGHNLRLAIVKFKGDNRYLTLSSLGGRYKDSSDGLKAYVTNGETFGHSAAKDAFSVAAAPANDPLPFDLEPGDPPNPRGPFPGAFGSAQKPERFTSDGPRKIYFNADGTPVTPGNFSSTGGTVRQKPDITAADGVHTTAPGFSPFFGTSAAAPHAAALAGLILSGNPGLAPTDVRAALTNTAVDIGQSGVDNVTGAGILLGDRILGYTGASPQPLAEAQAPIVSGANGSPFVNPGDTARVLLPVTNRGDGDAVSTSVVLTSSTPGVVVTPRSKFYGTIGHGQTGINTFTVSVPASQQLGVPVQLDARVTFAGSLSPRTTHLSVPIGQPSTVVHDFASTGGPLAIPDNDPTGVTVPLAVSGIGRASKLSFSVDGTTCSTDIGSTTVGIDHTFVGDLVGTLTSPSGASAVLFANSGGTGNNLCKVVFDDSAALPFKGVGSDKAPFTGTWRPAQSLNALLGPADGTWTFKVVDTAGADTGSVRAVSLHVSGYVTAGGGS
ncbi:S8 family serine peptidase [Actinocrispum wychmicini]|uniref:S8 family serine peptidase n=1 Tax=Actinocrispum wychmicini TaxID=1213861 RepID=UPI001FB70B16|nr:S8 family serine peptidase [Actinocrispum wychmicini]